MYRWTYETWLGLAQEYASAKAAAAGVCAFVRVCVWFYKKVSGSMAVNLEQPCLLSAVFHSCLSGNWVRAVKCSNKL